jgi:hypothetical protein
MKFCDNSPPPNPLDEHLVALIEMKVSKFAHGIWFALDMFLGKGNITN